MRRIAIAAAVLLIGIGVVFTSASFSAGRGLDGVVGLNEKSVRSDGGGGPYPYPKKPKTTTLTFDELSAVPVNGLDFRGVTFHFAIGGAPSTDATYGAFGPGAITFVQDPSLEGNAAGTLRLDFDQPTTVLRFGLALSTFGDLNPGATVELFNPGGHSRRQIQLNTSSLVGFTEGRFAYSGGAIGSAVITFASTSADRFALDNLTYRPPPRELHGGGSSGASAALRTSRSGW